MALFFIIKISTMIIHSAYCQINFLTFDSGNVQYTMGETKTRVLHNFAFIKKFTFAK